MKNKTRKHIIKYFFILLGLFGVLTACYNGSELEYDFEALNIQGEIPIIDEVIIDLNEQMVLDATLSEVEVVVAVTNGISIYSEATIESEELSIVNLGDSFKVKGKYRKDNELIFYEVFISEELYGYVEAEAVTESLLQQVEIKQYKIFDVVGTYWYNTGLIIVYASDEKQQYDLVYYNPVSNEAMTLYTGDRAVSTLYDVVETDSGLGFCFDGEILYLDVYSLDNIGRVFLDALDYTIGKDNTIYYSDGNQIKRRLSNGDEELFYSFIDNDEENKIKKLDLSEDESRLIFAIENEEVNTSWVELSLATKEVTLHGIYESDMYFAYKQTAIGYDYRKNNGIFTVDFTDGDRIDYLSESFTTESFLDKVYGANLLLIKDGKQLTVFDPEFNKVINRYRVYQDVKGYLNTSLVNKTIKVIATEDDLINIYSFDTGYQYVDEVKVEMTPYNAKAYIIEDTFVTSQFSATNPYRLSGADGLTVYDSNIVDLDRQVMLLQGSYYLDKWHRMRSIKDYNDIEIELDEFLSFDASKTRIAYLNLNRELIVLDRSFLQLATIEETVRDYRVFGDDVLYTIEGVGVFLLNEEGITQLVTEEMPLDYGYKEGAFYYVDEENHLMSINIEDGIKSKLINAEVATIVYDDEIVFTTNESNYSGLYYIKENNPVFTRVLPILIENKLDYGFMYKEEYYYGEVYENGSLALQSSPLGKQLLNDKAIYSDDQIILFTYKEQTAIGDVEVLALYEKEKDTFKILITGEEVVSYQEVEGKLFVFCESETLGSLYSLSLETLAFTNMYNVEGEIVKVSEDGSKVATMSYNVGWNFHVIDTVTGEILYEKKYADLITSGGYGIFITVGQQIIHINIETMAVKTLVYDCKDGYNARTYIHYNRTRNILYYHSINNVLYALDMKTLKATYVFSECVQIFRFVSDDTGFNKIYLLGGNGLIYNYNGTSILPLDLKEIISFSQYSKDTDFKDLVTRYGDYVIYTNTVNGTIHGYNEKEGYIKDLLRVSNENVEFRKVTIARSNGVQKLLVVYYSPTLGEVELYLDLDSLQ